MKKLMRKMRERKGFTLAELLIVVAIIAVLVAIAIPIFSNQLEKAKEATDTANVRAAYAEVVTLHIEDGSAHSMSVSARQGQPGWQNSTNGNLTTQVNGSESSLSFGAKTAGSDYTISIGTDGSVSIN